MSEPRQDLALEDAPVLRDRRRPQRGTEQVEPWLGVLSESDLDRGRPAPLGAREFELDLRFPGFCLLGASVALPSDAAVACVVLDVVARRTVPAAGAFHDACHRSTSCFERD